MDLAIEAFEFGEGDENLFLILSPDSAEDLIRALALKIRPKTENHGMGCTGRFYVGMKGSCICIKDFIKSDRTNVSLPRRGSG